MGDTTVDFFQETLKQLITSSKLGLTIDEKRQLQSLQEEIEYLRGFLKVTEKKRNSKLMELVMQIRDVVFEAENIIDLFVEHYFKRPKHQSLRQLLKVDHPSLDLESVKKEIKTLMAMVKQIYDMKMYDINEVAVKIPKHPSTGSEGGAGSSGGSNTSKLVRENVVVGFKEEVNRVIEKLDDRREGLEIIAIIGAGGGGKTTLAREVYDHPFTLHTFEIRAWIDVSQDYNKTMKGDLLIRILELASLGKHADYERWSEDKLGEDVHKCLKGRKYLIVMDDIWDIEAWNDMQRSFPKECKGSKVLFTSRQVVQPNISYVPHFLDPLPKNWSWELLQNKVFGMKCCPPELVDIGEQIAQKCDGLPLAIVTIAGILKKKDKTLKVWVETAKHLSSIIAKNQEGCMELLELSYNHLPLHLKACFLYIGGFDEDREIPIRNLIWLWIAEGFIQQSEGKSLEAMAKDYLLDLIDRSLIIVARKNPLGRIKACRIHDLLRELCLKKAEEDNFLVKIYDDESFRTVDSKNHCRLFIGWKFNAWPDFLGHRAQKVRTFLCPRLPKDSWLRADKPRLPKNSWLWEDIRDVFLENFKHLRVLSFITRGSLKEVERHLVHLRYLQLYHSMPKGSYCFEAPFSHHLETINFKTRNLKTIQLPYDIFMMVKLRHLYSKSSTFAYQFCLRLPSSSSKETARINIDHSSKLDSLQTLHSLCACKVCLRFLVRTPNLRKLGISGNLISEDGVLMIPDLEFLNFLETLSLKDNDFGYQGVNITLQKVLKLPSTITQLTLWYTRFKWEELSILQTALPSLEVLKLRFGCVGPVWNTSEEGFSQLKYLKLDHLDIEEWNAFEDQFPRLEVLVLHRCQRLEQIPMDFANLNELREIEVAKCNSSVEKLAREIQEEQRIKKGDDCCLNLRVHANTFPIHFQGVDNLRGWLATRREDYRIVTRTTGDEERGLQDCSERS